MSRYVNLHTEHLARTYAPSFYSPDAAEYINPLHARIQEEVADIRGKLEPADHLKLYEAAYFAGGPILEIGRLHGKSTVILASGARDGENAGLVHSIEYESRYLPVAEKHLDVRGLSDYVVLLQGDSSEVVRSLDGTFDTVFVDGDHTYEGVRRDLDALVGRVDRGGSVLIHDYYHPANDTGEYGVARAVDERGPDLGFGFRGRFGGIALFEVL